MAGSSSASWAKWCARNGCITKDTPPPFNPRQRLLVIPRAGYPAGGILVILFLTTEEDAEMDARPNTRRVDRERKPTPPQPPRGAKQIVIPMTRPLYDA